MIQRHLPLKRCFPMRTFHLCIIFLPPSARMTRPERFTPLRIPAYNRHAASSVAGSKVTDNHSFPVLSNRIPSSGYFPFPAHREPGQGSGNRRSAVLAEAYAFCEENRLPTAFIACRIESAVSDSPTQYSPVFNASADTDYCSLPRFFGDGVLFVASRRR